jgi:hypothetical protein
MYDIMYIAIPHPSLVIQESRSRDFDNTMMVVLPIAEEFRLDRVRREVVVVFDHNGTIRLRKRRSVQSNFHC